MDQLRIILLKAGAFVIAVGLHVVSFAEAIVGERSSIRPVGEVLRSNVVQRMPKSTSALA